MYDVNEDGASCDGDDRKTIKQQITAIRSTIDGMIITLFDFDFDFIFFLFVFTFTFNFDFIVNCCPLLLSLSLSLSSTLSLT
jgi:hypothetical protein